MALASEVSFGTLLRKLREASGHSMGALARHLELSTPYLCDVELGRRMPLTPEKIAKAARFLNLNESKAQLLAIAALTGRGAVDVVTPKSAVGRRAMAELQQRADHLTDEQWAQIYAVMERRK